MSILSTVQEEVERSIFEAIRLVLVEHGYLPDITTFTDDDAGVAAYEAAKSAIVTAKGFCIEVFGAGSSQKKYQKKVPRIVFLSRRHVGGMLGGGPEPLYEPTEEGKFTKLRQADKTTDYYFEISIVSNTAKQDRILNSIIALAVPARGYINFLTPQEPESFFVEQYSYRDSPITEEGMNEKFYLYKAIDLYEKAHQPFPDPIAPIREITVDITNEQEEVEDSLVVLSTALDIDAQAIIDAMVVTPDTIRQNLINATVLRLKDKGIWDKATAIYVMAAHTDQAGMLNWKDLNNPLVPGVLLTPPDFEADKGFTGGSGKYFKTGLISAAMNNYTLDDACIFAYSLTDITHASCLIGVYDGVINQSVIYPKWSDGNTYWSINSGSQAVPIVESDSIGLFSSVRVDNLSQKLYVDGVLVGNGSSGANVSTQLEQNLEFYILAINNNGSPDQFSARQVPFAGMGLGSMDQLELNNIITDYLTAIGAI